MSDPASLSLFDEPELPPIKNDFNPEPAQQAALGQYPTPFWVAQALVERHFAHLSSSDMVFEVSCGPGAFLAALPEHVPAIGFDIDPAMVVLARKNTGRTIIEGDFRIAELPAMPTALIGNPPFDMKVIDGFLDRAHALLPHEGQIGMILPCYAFQTAERVASYAERWSLAQEMIPRNIFPGLSLPLMFARFIKDTRRTLVGLFLYREVADVQKLPKTYREILSGLTQSVWADLVARAMASLGGRANLQALYTEIEGKQPTRTKWWREKIRQVLRRFPQLFKAQGDGWYELTV